MLQYSEKQWQMTMNDGAATTTTTTDLYRDEKIVRASTFFHQLSSARTVSIEKRCQNK